MRFYETDNLEHIGFDFIATSQITLSRLEKIWD